MQKTAAKNTKYSRNETILKFSHLAKAIDFAKWSVWLKNSNGQKRPKNGSASTLELFCAKNRWKNHQIFKNETILKIGHLARAIDFARWSVWVKKSKGQKRAKKDSTSTLELSGAKNRWKKHHILEKWDHFENRPSFKGYRLCKMVSLAQKLKWPKTCEKGFCKHVRVVLCKKPLEKSPNIQKWDHFENRPSCKGYRLCKVVSLGQKVKRPKTCKKGFYKHVRVVRCKKPLEKTPYIREMRPFWKSAILQRL